ncbi:MAG: hypothetical protein M1820_002500 [Bogoriella megaspora]|nr:MAG: hypothetical protein M1820_002500 [Bogoriella megaspora]
MGLSDPGLDVDLLVTQRSTTNTPGNELRELEASVDDFINDSDDEDDNEHSDVYIVSKTQKKKQAA